MLEVISYFVTPVLIILVGAYCYVEVHKKKVEEESKEAITLRVTTMKNNFKAAVKKLVEQEILTVKEQASVYQLANNFFVFQPITNNNIDYCEHLLKDVISAFATCGPDSINFDFGQEQISLFVGSLPVSTSDHNSTFYQKKLPELIKQLVDAKDNVYKKSLNLTSETAT
jgi:hypothetical protein